jgi:transcriptional regulator with XRE-family HTH domain
MNVTAEPTPNPSPSFRELRRAAGLTMRELAEKAGYANASGIQGVERGSQPRLERAQKLADVLGVTIDELRLAIDATKAAAAAQPDADEEAGGE